MSDQTTEKRDTVLGVTKGALHRLAESAGVKRLSAPVYDELRTVLLLKMHEVLRVAITYADHQRKKTIDEAAISAAIAQTLGSNITTDSICLTNLTKSKTAQDADSDCLILAKVTFERLSREISEQYKTGMRFTKSAMLVFQFVLERYLKELLKDANLNALNAKRTTLYTKDLELVRQLRGERGR